MRRYNPYLNIFYYYRGPSSRKEGDIDKQIEDNTTKALINTLKYSEPGLLSHFLSKVDIAIKKIDEARTRFDMQISRPSSRPDGMIRIDRCLVLIESKMDASLDEDQILEHLKLIADERARKSITRGYLLCITPREKDRDKISQIGKGNLRFVTWKKLYSIFKEYRKGSSDEKTNFVLEQFTKYLEAVGVSPFDGWNKEDFEAFLNMEEDLTRELRPRVKKKLEQYLIELEESLKKDGTFTDLEHKVGHIEKEDNYVWGVLCKPKIQEVVHKPHFNFLIDPDEFIMGIQIEGKKPAMKMKENIGAHRQTFLNILRKLDGFDLVIRKRIKEEHRPQRYKGKRAVTIKLREEYLTMEDVQYIIKKMEHLGLFELHCGRHFKRDDPILGSASFLKQSIEIIRKLKDYYDFSFGNDLHRLT